MAGHTSTSLASTSSPLHPFPPPQGPRLSFRVDKAQGNGRRREKAPGPTTTFLGLPVFVWALGA